MKTKILAFFAALAVWCPLAGSASSYYMTNDLTSVVNIFYWTNNGSSTVESLATNLAPTSNTVFTVSTNGAAGLGVQATNATVSILVPWTSLSYGTSSVSGFFTNALNVVAPAVETVPQTQSILKSYYITGAVPNEANYWEFIDTMFYYVYTAQINALAAQAAAVAASQQMISARIIGTTVVATNGCTAAAVHYMSFNSNTVYFAAARSTNFVICLGGPDTGVVFLRGTNFCSWTVPNAGLTEQDIIITGQ